MSEIKRIAVLGSTGSIGVNTLDVVSRLKGRFRISAISADSNIKLLAEQARKFRPKAISVGNSALVKKIKGDIGPRTKILSGPEGLNELASSGDVDLVVFAISGNACIMPLIKAIEAKKEIALANKEAMVSAGPLIMEMAGKSGVKIIPIDSEHSAIFQCIEGRRKSLSKIYLTGSGGPLLNIGSGKFDRLPREFILKHPRWKMGAKISVDSATMMNKGLEIIEAKNLFYIDEKFIEVLIHPEAIVHSMVELADGSVLAQMATADMRIPIQYALTYPERCGSIVKKIDFAKNSKLSFSKPDLKRFPCLGLARCAAKTGGTAPAALCAADEEAVKSYLDENIKFSDIAKMIEKVMSRHKNVSAKIPALRDIFAADMRAREEIKSLCCH